MRIKTSANEVLKNITMYIEDVFIDLSDAKTVLNDINSMVLIRIRELVSQKDVFYQTPLERGEYEWLRAINKMITEVMKEPE